ncbi:MAG: Gfo/Idh/MocA family oxidoreductase [Aestuariivirgaceae bacterium]
MAGRPVRVGLIGAGAIARCHVHGYRVHDTTFPESGGSPVLEMVAEATPELAAQAAARFGFRRAAADWRAVVESADIDVVDICVPSALHREITLAAITSGKAVYCEKPIGLSGGEASEVATAAGQAGVASITGYTYLRNPLIGLARRLIAEGTIGDVALFRGTHNEDYLSDPATPFSWRCDRTVAGAAGALGDLGSHIVGIALHLVGDIAAVSADTRIVIAERCVARGSATRRPVSNDDQALALLRFANGVQGYVEASRIATGSKMAINYEIIGTKGALRFEGERGGELNLHVAGTAPERAGFTRILTHPAHEFYDAISPGAGHGLSFNDHKVIEVHELMELVTRGRAPLTTLDTGARVGAVLDAVIASAANGRWTKVT